MNETKTADAKVTQWCIDCCDFVHKAGGGGAAARATVKTEAEIEA